MPMSSTDILRVENPCPVLLSRMTEDGQNYFCKSCSKKIVDFREKTLDEIKCSINKDTCGIFYTEQLIGQQKMSFIHQSIFYFLTILSFLGFTVRPVNAQTIKTAKDTVSVDIKAKKSDSIQMTKTIIKKDTSETKGKGLIGKKKKYRTVGTPGFWHL